MATTINGIKFNDLSRLNKGTSVTNIKNANIKNGDDLLDYINNDVEYRNIQSVLIDWNGAEVEDGVVINSTSDLLNWIKSSTKIDDIQINGESKGNSGTIDLGNYLTEHPDFGSKFISYGITKDTQNFTRVIAGLEIDNHGHIIYGKEISMQRLAEEIAKYLSADVIYMVSFKDGEEVIYNTSGIPGTTITLPKSPFKNGYRFVGWNTDPNALEAMDVNLQIDRQNITYYAIWEEYDGSYWYVGNDNPATMSSIDPIVDTNSTSAGWRLIDQPLSAYNSSNKLYEGQCNNPIDLVTVGTIYVAVPVESSLVLRDGFGADGTQVDVCERQADVTIAGSTYKVYTWVSSYLGWDIY